MEQVEVKGLYPERMAGLSVDGFLAELPSLDEESEGRLRARRCRARYCGMRPRLRRVRAASV